jgi:hypothetical protein
MPLTSLSLIAIPHKYNQEEENYKDLSNIGVCSCGNGGHNQTKGLSTHTI